MENILMVSNLNKKYGNKYVINDVTFNLFENEIVGFIGPNGAGKTTTMKAISGLIHPTSGKIEICGINLFKNRGAALSKISVQIESPSFYPDLSGIDNLVIFAKIKKVDKARVDEVVEFMNIGSHINRKAKTYSLGMKQRLGLAIALLSQPKVLVLDEPTNGLDYDGVIALRNILIHLARDKGVSILISSHQLGEIDKIAHRIVWIQNGKIIEVSARKGSTRYVVKTKEAITNEGVLKLCIPVETLTYEVSITEEFGINDFIKHCVNENIEIIELDKMKDKLENLYSSVMKDKR